MAERVVTEPLHGHGRISEDACSGDHLHRLARMSPEERLRASRYEFDRLQLAVWTARYPEEVPLVNGEYEWIALGLADLD